MTKQDLLIEIGTEELPPKALLKLINAFWENISDQLNSLNLEFNGYRTFATPRRLAVLMQGLDEKQENRIITKKGPGIKAAYDKEGNPSKAALGFAKSCGIEFDQLQTIKSDKGEWLSYQLTENGKTIHQLLPNIVETSLDKLPIPKRMRWGNSSVSFVRPVHWIVLLFGNDLIEAEIYSIKSGFNSRGHRFHHPQEIKINTASAYEKTLKEKGSVIADFETRKKLIESQVNKLASSIRAEAIIDNNLLDEVTAMVELPNAIMGEFDKEFLEVPAEALISAMKNHQKYFHLENSKGELMPNFITVCNIESKDPIQVKLGNERVIRPRLADSQFFWNQDQKQNLDEYVENLKTVTFQNKLGSLYDKTIRVQGLTSHIAKTLKLDVKSCERAALLSKCDLMTGMVGEFPDLQGIMGRYYATVSGENNDVAYAIEQHYQPRFSGDKLPESSIAQALALAEKMDTLVGIFGIGQSPTGDKDPFGLRRAALACVRILIEQKLELDLSDLLKKSASLYKSKTKVTIDQKSLDALHQFFFARIEVYYKSQGFSHDLIESVICLKPTQLNDLNKRLHALKQFQKLAEAESLAAANKRISNILKKSGDIKQNKIKTEHLKEDAEKNLAKKLSDLKQTLEPLIKNADYEKAMKTLSTLRQPVDDFFDAVMVMDTNINLRNNRLTLLKSLRDQFLRIADISKLQH